MNIKIKKCEFCKSLLKYTKISSYEQHYNCVICNYKFWTINDKINHIRWDRSFDGMIFFLNLYTINNTSFLCIRDCKINFKKEGIFVSHLIQNVNPQNVINKIKSLMVFS